LSLIDKPGSTLRHRIFILYVVAMLLAFLLPTPATPLAESQHVDKLVHFGIFLGFALVFYGDRHSRAWWIFLISVAFAGGIELLQSILSYRQGDWWDFVAGAAGAGLGTVLVLLVVRQRRRALVASGRGGGQ
jgi:VanZ family protein